MTAQNHSLPVSQPRARAVAALIPILALVGIGISSYLAYTRLAGTELYCAGSGGCETVNASVYALMLGVPVAYLGLAMYAVLLVLSLVQLAGKPQPAVLLAVFGLSLSGLIYSLYLTYVEVFILGAICLWCVASACVMALLFAASVARLRLSGLVRS